MSSISQDQVASYARAAGFTGSGLSSIVAIAKCESGNDPSIRGKSDPRDRGLVQINSYWHSEVSDSCAFDPLCSMQQAFRISKNGTDFSQWNTYKGTCYNQQIGQIPSTATVGAGGGVPSNLAGLPFGIGGAIAAVEQTVVNYVEEVGIFLIALIVIALGVFILAQHNQEQQVPV